MAVEEIRNTAFKVGEKVRAKTAEVKSGKTTPPEHYIDGTLLQDMLQAHKFIKDPKLRERMQEAEGLGTPATRATIISNLAKNGYVEKKKKGKTVYLITSDKGKKLVELIKSAGEMGDPGMTAVWEEYLKQIEQGKISADAFIEKQKQYVKKMIKELFEKEVSINFSTLPERKTKPCNCGGGGTLTRIESKQNKGQFFWVCSNNKKGEEKVCDKKWSDVKGEPQLYVPKERVEIEFEKMDGDGDKCPKCKKGTLITKIVNNKESKAFGKRYLACSNYPKCKHSEWEKSEKSV